MLLVIAATEIEMAPFKSLCKVSADHVITSVCGVGPVESAVSVTRILGELDPDINTVLNFGIGGAYFSKPEGKSPGLLDICLAERENMGDYGVCFGERVEPFSDSSPVARTQFTFDESLGTRARKILKQNRVKWFTGPFVTVNAASGTAQRGVLLKSRFQAICENMEGAAIARACDEFTIPMLEVRAISNMVEDRPGSPWKIGAACHRAAEAASFIVHGLLEGS